MASGYFYYDFSLPPTSVCNSNGNKSSLGNKNYFKNAKWY